MNNQKPPMDYGLEIRQPLLLRLDNTTNDTRLTLDRLESLLNDFEQAIDTVPFAAACGGTAPEAAKRFTITSIAEDAQSNSYRISALTDRLSDLLSRL